jgi:hypothetical protein
MNFIVTTTINSPTEALKKYSEINGWKLIVVGDVKTPKKEYDELNCIYLDLEEQEKINKELSNLIGFNSLERRNFGYIYAYKSGAQIIASVDDDNIPLDNWGKDLTINKETEINHFISSEIAFDPLSATNINELWHRGFPIELLETKNKKLVNSKINIKPKVQADLWNGDPDIDAICRIGYRPEVEIAEFKVFNSNAFSPFNTQNTFFDSSIMKYFMQLPFVGRMSDIWGSYLFQKLVPEPNVVYCNASVYQKRNPHNLVEDLELEMIGYKNTLNFLKGEYSLPNKVQKAFKLYQDSF